MTAPKPKPAGGQRRAIARHHNAPKAITRERFERRLIAYWGCDWLFLLLATLAATYARRGQPAFLVLVEALAADAGRNRLGPPPLERPQEPPARESSGGYDSDASLGSICGFIPPDSESDCEGESAPRRRRGGVCPNADIRPCCTWIEKHKKRRFPPPCLGRKLRVLDLCSGTGSVKRALLKLIMPDVRAKHRSKHRRGFIYVSIDSVSSGDIKPTIQGDVRQWHALLEAKNPKYVSQDPAVWKWDIVFASPPCEKFSFGNKTVTKKQEREALRVVQACLDCVLLLRPTVYFIENSYGRLWKTKLMEPYRHQMYVVSHCRYGASYRKHTCIWSSIRGMSLRKCGTRHTCDWLRLWSNHNNTAQNGYDPDGRDNGTPREKLYRVPGALMRILIAEAMRVAQEASLPAAGTRDRHRAARGARRLSEMG